MNFCPNCGEKVESDQNFCTNCGYSLNGNNDNVKKQQLEEKDEININEPAPVGIKGGLNRDLKEPQILNYKQKMGLKTGIENVLIGQIPNMGKMIISAAWAALSAKYFVISFEEQGIVLIGINAQGRFNGKNAYIPKESISSISYRPGVLKMVLTIVANGGKNKFNCPSTILGSPFQSQNIQNRESILQEYPA
ncbi:zinc-ribbon domain-containing protein [Apilactobacillus timberlakei]|uniref:zinc-ribbon domain-containing protein n=1 Tax=Apilactobacillus timberlakei TaxID=2008380 RepID=UPI00112A9C0B|nr:zinc ribbon domain-containing protein [Apilactobacillus timberlakei]TPR16683.1 zinc ribbon domain-containing protein [Apilactobacillus timberlakei]